jgi:hypothetical protein
MKTRFILALALVALTLGITHTVPAAQAAKPNACDDLCSRVRCAYPTVCGPYIDASGQQACGCH